MVVGYVVSSYCRLGVWWYVDVDNVYELTVSGADPDGLCFYCGVWVDEVLCNVCDASVLNSVMYKCY